MLKLKDKMKNCEIYLLFLIMILPLFKIEFLYDFWLMKKIYFVLTLNSFFLILYLSVKKNLKLSKIFIYIIFYFILLGFSTIINNGNIKKYIFTLLTNVTLYLVTEYGIKFYPRQFVKILSIFFKVLVYINFVSILIHPLGIFVTGLDGAYSWILGHKNAFILYIFPALLFSCFDSFLNKKQLTLENYILFFVSFISLFLVKSSASVVGIFIIGIYIFFPKMFKNSNLFNIINYIKINIFFFFLIVVVRLQNIFRFIIVNILNKDLTITGRTYIWDMIIKLIHEKQILGHGLVESEIRLKEIGNYHSHNFFLEILYQSGIIGLILILIVLFLLIFKLYQNKEHKIIKFVSLMLFALFTILIVESFDLTFILYIFIVLYNIEYLINENSL